MQYHSQAKSNYFAIWQMFIVLNLQSLDLKNVWNVSSEK